MATLNGQIQVDNIMLCISKKCPNKNRCRHSVELDQINLFPTVYTVADLSSICLWYTQTMEQLGVENGCEHLKR